MPDRKDVSGTDARLDRAAGDHVSRHYQDYVIRDGKYIGQFEEMYRNSAEIPWHQDLTVDAVFSDLTVAILRRRPIHSLLDVGCGYGFMTNRLPTSVPGLRRVVGLDVSATAVETARRKFPELEFRVGTIDDVPASERFDAVVSKDVLWYVLANLTGYLAALAARSDRYVYVGQSFPERVPFLGDDVLPDAARLFEVIDASCGPIVYSVVERDAEYGGREYAHAVVEVRR